MTCTTVARSSVGSGGVPMRFRWILAMAFAVVFLAAAAVRAQDVTLSGAGSLKDATEELGRGFMAAHPAVTLRYNCGASGDLQKQIEAGAAADLFPSPAPRQMDRLGEQRLIVPAGRPARSPPAPPLGTPPPS